MAVIGIDLGTTNSLAAYWKDGVAELIELSDGVMLPSVVSMDENENFLVGAVAKERKILHMEQTVGSFKRFMGTEKKWLLGEREYSAVELSAMVLRKMKEDVEAKLGEAIEEAVITVPAYFNDRQRSDTKLAAQIAGLTVERLINEPSAAALAYQMNADEHEHNLLIFDFGGGTLDLSLVECFDNVIEIIGVAGDNHLGGDDIDDAIIKLFCEENHISYEELELQEQAVIRKSAQNAKIALSTENAVDIVVKLKAGERIYRLTEETLFESCTALFQRMRKLFLKILKDAGYRISDIDDLIMVGGSSKLPLVQHFLRELLGKQPVVCKDPDLTVALGAGTYAGIRMRKEEIKDIVMTDVCPFTLGVETYRNVNDDRPHILPLIFRNATLPASHTKRVITLSDFQNKIKVKVYQGEEYYAQDNLLLGSLEIAVPERRAGEAGVDITFTYDINGILQVELENDNGKKEHITFLNEKLKQKEVSRCLEEMEKVKIQPMEEEQTQILMERMRALYAQASEMEKESLDYLLSWFIRCLESKRRFLVRRAMKEMRARLDEFERTAYSAEEFFFDGEEKEILEKIFELEDVDCTN